MILFFCIYQFVRYLNIHKYINNQVMYLLFLPSSFSRGFLFSHCRFRCHRYVFGKKYCKLFLYYKYNFKLYL